MASSSLFSFDILVGAVVLVALVQGELNQLVRWGDADDDEKEKERTKKRKEAKKQVGETEEDRVVSVGKALTEGPGGEGMRLR